ncbi:hypothetical protein FJT64_009942 [Amphibalanus amphitrite]|uniref:Uncharacterized protein n=1 Tax=Amphibalanus amphitrite TaxID=1232801 RepID=A0A6A4V6W0_AMPAM|nr:hypothetical protein FJT64_009942 [Amphibalanus amphitrite]
MRVLTVRRNSAFLALPVEELTLTAELRQRSMEAARALSTAGADRSGAAAAAPGRRPPPLLLDVASVSAPIMEPFRALLKDTHNKHVYWDEQLRKRFEEVKSRVCQLVASCQLEEEDEDEEMT